MYKKSKGLPYNPDRLLVRTLLTMKLSILLVVFTFSQASAVVNAQTVTVSVRDATLLDVFKLLKKQTGYDFLYASGDIQAATPVTLELKETTLRGALDACFRDQALVYEIKGTTVLVRKGKGPADMTEQRGASLVAMQQREVSGQVVAAEGEPLAGVTIAVKGQEIRTVTDENGRYSLERVPSNATLVATSVGYETNEQAATSAIINFVLSPKADELQEVVVTAMDIKRSREALGYSVQEVKSEELQKGGNSQLLNALSGKVAGVNISQNPAIGGSSRVVIRGESTISGNNQPLYVIDGIPLNNDVTASAGANVDFGDGMTAISPELVESISVLKGPNAAALYGSRAANGVILITTKKGRKNTPLTVDFTISTSFQSILKLPEYQNQWGGGKGPEYHFVHGNGTDGGEDGQGVNFGPRLNEPDPTTESGFVERVQFGSPIDPITGERIPIPWVAYPNNVRDFFKLGHTLDNSLSASGGSERSMYRVSYSQTDQQGTVPNTDFKRKNFNTSLSFDLGKFLTITSNLNYVNSGSDNIPADGYSSSLMYNFLWFYRNVDIDWVKDYWLPGQEGYQQRNFETLWVNNVYFIVNENTNSFRKHRGIGNIMADVKFLPNLKLTVKSNLDLFTDTRETRIAMGDRYVPNGRYTKQDIFFRETNNEFLLTYDKVVNDNFEATVSVGGNQRKMTRNYGTGQAPGLNIPFIYNFGNASGEVLNTQSDSRKQVNSLYSFANFSFFNAVYLDLTARNDWSSALTKPDGSGNNSYFYPSASLSFVASKMLQMPQAIDYLKLRSSWARVGNDTDPYRLFSTFTNAVSWGGRPVANENTTIFNENLKPEIITSSEVGLELRALDSRVTIDATAYRAVTKNQILSLPTAASSGYNGKIINAGEIRSSGVEVAANGTLIRKNNLDWNIGVNWMTTQSKVVRLEPGITNYIRYSYNGNTIEAREGGYMGDMYGQVFEKSPEGEVIYYNGLPRLAPEKVKIGNYNPDWKAGYHTNVRYKNLAMSVLFDHQQGGLIYSYTHARGVHAGSLTNSGEQGNIREDGIIGKGVIANGDGTFRPNDVVAPAFDFVRQSVTASNIEVNTFDATYLKLREVNLSYRFSQDLVSRIKLRGAQVSLFGNNLVLWTKVPHIDPDNAYQEGGKFLAGMEILQLPPSRTFGLRLNVTF
ncbi:SusC/RagA family TonB-linked outer membrane protein [Parapedobacter sp.]